MLDNVHELGIRPDGQELRVETLERYIMIVNLESPGYPDIGEIHLLGYSSHPQSEITFSPDSRYVYLTDALQCIYEVDCTNLSFGDLYRVLVIDTAAKSVVQIIPMQSPYSATFLVCKSVCLQRMQVLCTPDRSRFIQGCNKGGLTPCPRAYDPDVATTGVLFKSRSASAWMFLAAGKSR